MQAHAGLENLQMAIYDFIPATDLGYKSWLQNFAARCEAYEIELGLTPEQVTLLKTQSSEFGDLCNLAIQKKRELQGVVADKDYSRRVSTETVRAITKQIKGNAAVSPEILGSLGVVQPRTSGPVVPVSKLVVKGTSDGVNSLTWDRNGNAQGTVFLIESRREGSTLWNFVAAVTKTQFKDEDQIPGQTQYYRIKASRSGKTSNPCGEVIIYPQGLDQPVSLAV